MDIATCKHSSSNLGGIIPWGLVVDIMVFASFLNGCSWISLPNCPIWSSSRHSNLDCSPLPSSICWGCSPVPLVKWLVRLRLCRCHTSACVGPPTSGFDSLQKILSKGDLRHSSKASLKWPMPSLFNAINNLILVPMAPVEAPALCTEWNPIVTSVIYSSTYPETSSLVGQRAVVKVMAGIIETKCWTRWFKGVQAPSASSFYQRKTYLYIKWWSVFCTVWCTVAL